MALSKVMSVYMQRVCEDIVKHSVGFVLTERRRFSIRSIVNTDSERSVEEVLEGIGMESCQRAIRTTYVNRRLLTRDRFRATWGDEIALNKRLLLLGGY